ncbi:MAG TPA: hypothetical protein VJ800_12735 [Pseudolabrys sp.]|nr:hypothetical protein [Pseudolabrys sp.]
MLLIVRRNWLRRTGFVAAALCVLAWVAPAAAVTLSADLSRTHCLDEIHVLANHHQTADHQHSTPADQTRDQTRDQGQSCCGLFGVTAIAPSYDTTSVPIVVATSIAPTPSENLFGWGLDRIDRPPRSPLSL